MSAVALILAAGRGTRLGAALPKALLRIEGRRVLEWSAAALGAAPSVGAVLPVVGEGFGSALDELHRTWRGPADLLPAVRGGETRQASLAHGLAAVRQLPQDVRWVLVHDAARCLVLPSDAENGLQVARATGAAIPVVPVGDTLKEISGERVCGTLDRARLAGAQTPQVFRLDLLERALQQARHDGFDGTDCSSLVERIGVEIAIFPGREQNRKLTTPADLDWIRWQLARDRQASAAGAARARDALRIGQGFDVHRLVEGRALVLAGVRIPHDRGLAGHSDADVLAHAVGDALLGALVQGDLGMHFPSSDARYANASGGALLEPILERMRAAGLVIGNVDATVIAQEPRLGPWQAEIREGLAKLLDISELRVNVKLKSTDGLGAIGRGEGIAAQAMVLLEGAGGLEEGDASNG